MNDYILRDKLRGLATPAVSVARRGCTDRYSSQLESNYFTEMCSGSEACSYLRRSSRLESHEEEEGEGGPAIIAARKRGSPVGAPPAGAAPAPSGSAPFFLRLRSEGPSSPPSPGTSEPGITRTLFSVGGYAERDIETETETDRQTDRLLAHPVKGGGGWVYAGLMGG